MFGKGFNIFTDLINKIDTVIFKKSNTDYPNHKIHLTPQQSPPLIIDHVVFELNTLLTIRQSLKVRKQILKHYDDKYLISLELNALGVEAVGDKYFLFIKKSTQTKYNHGNSIISPSKIIKYLKQIHQNTIMVKHLWSIDFPKLKVLNISKHNLSSIEGITFLNIPNLECLQLHTNNIQSIDCLSKISTPKLRILTVYNNKIQNGDKLARCSALKLKEYEIDCVKGYQGHKIQNVDFLFKMKNLSQVSKIYIRDNRRIIQSSKVKFIEHLKQKLKLPFSYKYLRKKHNIVLNQRLFVD